MSLLLNLLVTTLALLVGDYILAPVHVDGFWTAVIVAVILGVINTFIKPILTILTLPLTIITFGLFALVLNALSMVVVDYFVSGLSIDGFVWAMIYSLIVSIVSSLLNSLFNK